MRWAVVVSMGGLVSTGEATSRNVWARDVNSLEDRPSEWWLLEWATEIRNGGLVDVRGASYFLAAAIDRNGAVRIAHGGDALRRSALQLALETWLRENVDPLMGPDPDDEF
jgi:hypothetical protein